MEKKKYPKLLEEMKKHKEKQRHLAILLGITQATVSRKLSGKVEFGIDEIDRICEHYGKDYYTLFK